MVTVQVLVLVTGLLAAAALTAAPRPVMVRAVSPGAAPATTQPTLPRPHFHQRFNEGYPKVCNHGEGPY